MARDSSSHLVAFALSVALCVVAGGALADEPKGGHDVGERALERARNAFAMAQAAYAEGDLDAARSHLQRAHELAPSAELSYDLARVHERMGDAATAIALYREYLQHHRPAGAEAARIARSIAELEALAKRQGDALRAPPPDAAILDAEARAMFARGVEAFRAKRFEVAHTAFLAARSIAALPELDYNLARACEELGRTRDAIDHYRAFLHHATPDEAAATRARIAALQKTAADQPPQPRAAKRRPPG